MIYLSLEMTEDKGENDEVSDLWLARKQGN